MRILADVHISPRTVAFLCGLGHDVVRVSDLMPADSSDKSIVDRAAAEQRVVLTQDLDFSAIVALSGRTAPSVISLRLSSSRVDHVNAVLEAVLPTVEEAATGGAILSVEDTKIRRRDLPVCA